MNVNKILFSGLIAFFLTGCAHPIKVSPDIAKIENRSGAQQRISALVAYYIPPELTALEVTTPGGGGDNVRYFPYLDIESGFEKTLSNVFSNVVKLPSAPDYSRINQQGIDYIIQPQLVTSSGSTGVFTWPPTNFSVDLTSNVRDATGKVVANPRVLGVGTAETGEKIREHGISGRRAMEDALSKMQAALLELKLGSIKKDSTVSQLMQPAESGIVEVRLGKIKDLYEKGLISKQEYETKKKEILASPIQLRSATKIKMEERLDAVAFESFDQPVESCRICATHT